MALSDGPWPAGWSGRDGAAVVGRPSRRRLGQHWSPGNAVPRAPPPDKRAAAYGSRPRCEGCQGGCTGRRFSKPGPFRRLPATQPHHLRRLAPSSAPLRSSFSMLNVGAEATELFGDHDQQALTRPNRPRRRSPDRAELAPRRPASLRDAISAAEGAGQGRRSSGSDESKALESLCSGCLQRSLQIFPGHLCWPFRSHFGNLWRSIPNRTVKTPF